MHSAPKNQMESLSNSWHDYGFVCVYGVDHSSLFRFLLQLFKEEMAQVKEGMKHINDLAHQLAISDVHLSMENARALEHLNNRWKLLQVVNSHHPYLILTCPQSLIDPMEIIQCNGHHCQQWLQPAKLVHIHYEKWSLGDGI